MNKTLIGNKARYITERKVWIEIERMESEPRLSALDVCNKALGSIYSESSPGRCNASGRVPFPSFGTSHQGYGQLEAPDGWRPSRDA